MTAISNIHRLNFSRKFTVNSLFFLIPLYFVKIGLSGVQIGTIVSLYGLAPLLFSFPMGWINDRLSIKAIIRIALIGLAVLFTGLALTQEFLILAAIFLLIGLANNALDVSVNSLYYKDETPGNNTMKYSRYVFWLSLGVATGTAGGGVLAHISRFQTVFFVYAAIMLLANLTLTGVGRGTFENISVKEYRFNLVNPKTLLFAVMIFVLSLHWGAEGTVYSPFLRERFGLNAFQLSLYISIPLFFLSLGALWSGRLKDRPETNRRTFLIALSLSGMGHILMVVPNVAISFFFRLVHEVGDGIMGALIVLFISRLFEKRSIGGSSGILLAVMTTGHMVGALVFSTIGYSIGLLYPFVLSGGLLLLNAVYGWFLFRRLQY